MAIVHIGIDLAKNVFAVHAVDAAGKPVLVRPSVPRAKLLELIAALPPCLIGMEACSGAHHWAREFQEFGCQGSPNFPQSWSLKFPHPVEMRCLRVIEPARP